MERSVVDRATDGRLQDVTHFFKYDVAQFKKELARLESVIDPNEVPSKNKTWREVLAAFERSRVACRYFEMNHGADRQLIADVQQGFRQETDPWFQQSWIGRRARLKPSGFAGDYDMLLKLYARATEARGLGGYLDLVISELPLARAVRARMESVRQFLRTELAQRQGPVRILDIASGPCQEYLNWQDRLHEGTVEVLCLDNDPAALQYVDDHVTPTATGIDVLRSERYNALRTRSSSANRRKFGTFDIIYSVGLCDYLTDEHLVDLLEGWRGTLAKDGVMYVAFKDTLEYDKTPYQWHLDWHFYQRTQDDCLDLFARAGCDVNAMEVTRDATGIIMNFIVRPDAQRVWRLDSTEDVLGVPISPTSQMMDK